MLVLPDTTVRVAVTDETVLQLDVSDEISSVVLVPFTGDEQELEVSDNTATLPTLDYPNRARIKWDGFTTYVEVVSRHYFTLDALSGYGDGRDGFDELDEDVLREARQAATEVFELNARRSFVHRIGRTKDYGRGNLLNLAHNDVYELLTDGYALVSDNQAVRTGRGHPFPLFVHYDYGADEVPSQVSRAVLELAAYMLRPTNRPVGATGESSDAGYIHFTVAGRDGATDIPEVNAAIQQFGRAERALW